MIQRIESLSEYDSKNRTFFFLNTTQWIEPIFLNVSQIEIFGWKIVKKKNKIDFFTWPEESNPLFFNMTQRIEPFSIGLKDSMLFSLTQRIELCLNRTDRIGPFFLNMTQRIEIFSWFFYMSTFFKNDAENWTLFLWIWRKELNPFFFECDVKNLIFFLNMTQRIEPFSYLTQRNELLFLDMNDSKNCIFQTKNTQWIELLKYDSKNWTFEPCVKKKTQRMAQRIEPFVFLKMSQRIEFFFSKKKKCSKNWTSLSFELLCYMTQWIELFSQFDSKSWVFSNMTRKSWTFFFFWIWLKEVSLFLNMTQRIDPFSKSDSKNRPFF